MVNLYVLVNRVIDLVLRPTEGLHPLVPLALWSVIMGVVAMIIYKYTSKQDGIKDAKERIKGHFYEVWLYIDDAVVISKAQANIMKNAFRYMGYALPPLVIMIVLFFPLFANFETRFAMKPVPVDGEVMVKLRLAEEYDGWMNDVKIDLPEGVEMVGHPVRFVRKVMESDKSLKVAGREYEVDYKLKPETAGTHELKFTAKGVDFTIPFMAGDAYGERVSPYNTNSLGDALLWPPAVTPPADSGVEAVEINYPEADFPVPGWPTWWVWPFLIISVVAAMAVKGVFNVEI